MQTYKLGDVIRLEIDLEDESGVATVSATFIGPSGKTISMNGYGEGKTKSTVVLIKQVTEEMHPGVYKLTNFAAHDLAGNVRHMDLQDRIAFQIDTPSKDAEGPTLIDISLK